MIVGLCRLYHALPEAGGLMDQPAWLLTLHGIMAAAGEPPEPAFDPLEGIPMEAL